MPQVSTDNLSKYIVESHVKANIMDILSDEKYSIMIKKDFDTACWYYDFKSDSNKIFIGDNIFERKKDDYTDDNKIVLSYFIHEAAHSIYTDKDLEALSKRLKEEKLDFKLFNLFEDARIESMIRSYYGYSFNWTDWEDIPEDTPVEKASTTLFKIIQTEDRLPFDVPYYEKVKEYYDRIINATTSEEMIKIMKNWMNDFPNDITPENNKNVSQDKSNSQGEDEKSDLEMASELQSDEQMAEEFEKDTKMITGEAKEQLEQLEQEMKDEGEFDNENHIIQTEIVAENIELETSTTSSIFSNSTFRPDKIFVDKLESAELRLRRILFREVLNNKNISTPTPNFNIKGAVRAISGDVNAKPFKKKVSEEFEQNKKNITIIMDGSSSMSGLPEKNMLTFAIVANRLASMGLFEGQIIGSKVTRKAVNQSFYLPVSDGLITSFSANAGGEGIGFAIEKNIEEIDKSDYVFCLTDGNINDKDLEFIKELYPSIYDKTIAIYMGDIHNMNTLGMSKWFKHTIGESKFEDVIEKIVNLLDPTVNSYNILNEMTIEEKNDYYYEETFSNNRL